MDAYIRGGEKHIIHQTKRNPVMYITCGVQLSMLLLFHLCEEIFPNFYPCLNEVVPAF